MRPLDVVAPIPLCGRGGWRCNHSILSTGDRTRYDRPSRGECQRRADAVCTLHWYARLGWFR